MPEWVELSIFGGVVAVGTGMLAIQFFLMSRDHKAWRREMDRERRERRLGGRIDAAGQRRLETSGAARGLPEFGGRLSQRAIMTDSEWVARLPASGPASD